MKPMMQNTMKMSARTAPTQTATAAMVVREMFGFVVGEGGRVGDWRSPGWGGGGHVRVSSILQVSTVYPTMYI